jgi:hypothetical protein
MSEIVEGPVSRRRRLHILLKQCFEKFAGYEAADFARPEEQIAPPGQFKIFVWTKYNYYGPTESALVASVGFVDVPTRTLRGNIIGEWQDVYITVLNKEYLPQCQRFGEAYEQMTGKSATIVLEY